MVERVAIPGFLPTQTVKYADRLQHLELLKWVTSIQTVLLQAQLECVADHETTRHHLKHKLIQPAQIKSAEQHLWFSTTINIISHIYLILML